MIKYKGDANILIECIADSISAHGSRITTLRATYHRYIHAEMLRHRVFSSSVASSRAIPIAKNSADIKENMAVPIHWGAKQKGMQADEECEQPIMIQNRPMEREQAWRLAASGALAIAQAYESAGYHKQIINRLTEPFKMLTHVITTTEWENFLELRLDSHAQYEIQEVAKGVKYCLENSEPVELSEYDWHLPFLTEDDRAHVLEAKDRMLISAARCARTSYFLHGTKRVPSMQDDLTLSRDVLIPSRHLSPFEHVACPESSNLRSLRKAIQNNINKEGDISIQKKYNSLNYYDNFRRWTSYRYLYL